MAKVRGISEKRFTGWVDVDLTDNGKLEAEKSGLLIREKTSLSIFIIHHFN